MKFLESLLSTTELRQLDMITYLVGKHHPIPCAEVFEEFSISETVFKETLKDIQARFKGMTITLHKETIDMQLPINYNLQDIHRLFLRDLEVVELGMIIFRNPNLNDLELAEELHISPSTLYRRVKEINAILKEYDVQIETNPYQVLGDEKNVRNLFLRLFIELYPPLFWPDFIAEAPFDQIAQVYLDHFETQINVGSYQTLKLSLLINLMRFKQGFFAQMNDEGAKRFVETMSAERKKKLKNIIEKDLGVPYSISFVTQFLGPIANTCYFLSQKDILNIFEQLPDMIGPQTYLFHFFEKIESNFDLEIPNRTEIIDALHVASYHSFLEIGNKGIAYEPSFCFNQSVKTMYPKFYQTIQEGLATYVEMMPYKSENNSHIIDDLTMVLFVTWKGLMLRLGEKLRSIKVLIISRNSLQHAKMIKDYIALNFSHRIQTTVYTDAIIDIDKIEKWILIL